MAVQTPLWLDLAAVFTSAVMGALVAVRRDYGVVGADKALVNGIDPFPAVLVGLAAAVGGGVLRDVLTAQPPAIFRRGELYALTALAGIVLYVMLDQAGVRIAIGAVLAVAVTTGLRVVAVRLGWEAPVPVDAVSTMRRSVSRRR